MKPSRLQLRLEEGIRSARNMFEADCLRAERAGYLARIGQFDEVQVELAALHERYDPRPNVEMSAWLNLVEGLVIFSRDMGQGATDKFRRAHALSRAADLVRLRALSAAWLAHMHFLDADIQAMAVHLVEAFSFADQSQLAALGRAHLVVAQGYHQGGRLDLALPWYFSARDNAVSEGDDAALSALMHNMAWLRASNMRQQQLQGNVSIVDNDHALLGAQSTENYDLLVGVENLHAHVPVLKAKIFALNGKAAEALVLFDEYLSTAISEGLGRLQADLLADRAWCRLQVGQIDEARSDAALAASRIDPAGQPDDRAFAHSRLVEVFLAFGDSRAAAHQKILSDTAWREYSNFQKDIIESLDSLNAKRKR